MAVNVMQRRFERGSRAPFKRRDEVEILEDFHFNVDAAGIFLDLWSFLKLFLKFLVLGRSS